MFELYGVGKDGMVYRSPLPRRKEVDILSEVGRTSPAKVPLLIVSTRELPSNWSVYRIPRDSRKHPLKYYLYYLHSVIDDRAVHTHTHTYTYTRTWMSLLVQLFFCNTELSSSIITPLRYFLFYFATWWKKLENNFEALLINFNCDLEVTLCITYCVMY